MKEKNNTKTTHIFNIVLIVLLGVIVYGNSIKGEFIWDDEYLVKNNVYIRNISYLPQIFTNNIAAGAGRRYRAYRPLQIVTYMVDYWFWKLKPYGYHSINIALHIFVAVGIYFLIFLLYRDFILTLLSGVFFVVHPIHTEAVTYISGRADSLAGIFILASLIFYIKYLNSQRKVPIVVANLSYILALLSRENSIILPGLFLLYHYVFRKRIEKKYFLSFVLISIIYIWFRIIVMPAHTPVSTTIGERLPGFFVAIATYLRLLLLPLGLHMPYGLKTFSFLHPKAIIGMLVVGFSVFYLLRRRKYPNIISFSLLWFFITLLPSSNIYPLNAYMAEHWLYLPSVGFFILVAYVLSWLYRRKKLYFSFYSISISLVLFYGILTIRQNIYWQEPITFYRRALKYAPHSPLVYTNLGKSYYEKENLREAIVWFNKSLELSPNETDTLYNLAVAYSKIGNKEKALTIFNKLLLLNPYYPNVYNGLGIIYFQKGEKDKALSLFEKAIQIYPFYVDAWYNLGKVLHNLGKHKEALVCYQKVIKIDPFYKDAYFNQALLYTEERDIKRAIQIYRKLLMIDPDDIDAYNNLGLLLYEQKNYNEAIRILKEVIRRYPSYAKAYNNLGLVYRELAMNEEAILLFKKAISLEPTYLDAYNNLGISLSLKGENEQAIAILKEAVKIDPSYAKAYNNLAIIYYREGKYDLARQYCAEALERGFVNSALLHALKSLSP